MLAIAVGFLLTACGATTNPDDLAPEVFIEPPVTTQAATTAFGESRVEEAYDLLTAFALAYAFQTALLDPERSEYTVPELTDDVLPHLSPAARSAYRILAVSAATGRPESQDAVRVLRFHRWNEPRWSLPEDGDPVVFQHITDPRIDLEPATADRPDRLVVNLVHTAKLQFREDGNPFAVEVRKTMTYWMIPSTEAADPAWLIDAYQGVFAVSQVRL